jgi:hypothetical protein
MFYRKLYILTVNINFIRLEACVLKKEVEKMGWKAYAIGSVIIYILAFAVYAYYQGFP